FRQKRVVVDGARIRDVPRGTLIECEPGAEACAGPAPAVALRSAKESGGAAGRGRPYNAAMRCVMVCGIGMVALVSIPAGGAEAPALKEGDSFDVGGRRYVVRRVEA